MKLAYVASFVAAIGLAACGRGDEDSSPSGRETSARLHAFGDTVVATWTWSTSWAREETRFRVSRDRGRTFGPTRSLGEATGAVVVSIAPDGRAAIFYRRGSVDLATARVESSVEVAFVEPGQDHATAPVVIDTVRLSLAGISPAGFASDTISVTERAGGGWLLAHHVPSESEYHLSVLSSDVEGRSWTTIDGAFEQATDALVPAVPKVCHGASAQPFFLFSSIERPLVLRLGDGVAAARWPLGRVFDILPPRVVPGAETTLPGLPDELSPSLEDCAADGDHVWMLFNAVNRITEEQSLWTIELTLADGHMVTPARLPGGRGRFIDARIFAEGGRIFAGGMAELASGCNLLVWSGDVRFAEPRLLETDLRCSFSATSVWHTGGFGLGSALAGNKTLLALTRFDDDDSAMRAHIEVMPVSFAP